MEKYRLNSKEIEHKWSVGFSWVYIFGIFDMNLTPSLSFKLGFGRS